MRQFHHPHVSADLVTLPASLPHPGMDPFRRSKVRRAAKAALDALDLDLAEKMLVALAIKGQDISKHSIQFPPSVHCLIELAREGK